MEISLVRLAARESGCYGFTYSIIHLHKWGGSDLDRSFDIKLQKGLMKASKCAPFAFQALHYLYTFFLLVANHRLF